MYRYRDGILEIFLVHPGGPYWRKKDAEAWSIPKGEFDHESEDALSVAKREFQEETGYSVDGNFVDLGTIKQSGGKIVHAWGIQGDCDAAKIESNTFTIEWPPRSGKKQAFPEVDRAEWLDIDTAKLKLNKSQLKFIDRFMEKLSAEDSLKK
jgi:predicted NUDIX family NTP pyrophosphohydrolase